MNVGIKSNDRGFTIIELLIVVVVIAILAAIIIVSYNGITQRAYNSQIVSGVKTYYEVIQAYYSENNSYPQTTGEQNNDAIALTCLGVGYQNQYCGKVTNTDVYEDPVFNQQLSAYLRGNGTPISNVLVPVPGESYVGAVYGIDSVDTQYSSTGYGRVIEYALHGSNQSCGISEAYVYSTSSGGTGCEILLEKISH